MKRRTDTHRSSLRAGPENSDAFRLAAARLNAPRPVRRARLQSISALVQSDRNDLAEKAFTEYLARYPDDADALLLKARTIARLGRAKEALSVLVRCLELDPDFVAARFVRAKLLLEGHSFRPALDDIDYLLRGDGGNPVLLQLKAGLLTELGEDENALAIREQLAGDYPGRAQCWAMYGNSLRAMGRQEQSVAAYRKAIACEPSLGVAWWSLANLKTYRFGTSDLATMQEQMRRPDVAGDDRIDLLFSLGKAYEDAGDYERSFDAYARGNAARRLRVEYDWDDIASEPATQQAIFTREFLESRRNAGCKAADPIFVVGRPRSGSTLIEQILSSHSAVEGTAELPYMTDIACEIGGTEPPGYPEMLVNLDASTLDSLGQAYLARARGHRRLDRPFFIDKAPANYHHIGLIHLILPSAKIIDARRNPAACCFSMFKHNYVETNLRLNELGSVYRDYVALLAHFDRLVPGRIHRVIYERMVADPETEIRRLLEHLGLPFEESCLRFYETKRVVRTPSSEQVRRPISDDAVEYWRRFEPWLRPLVDSLGSVLTEYPCVPEELR